MALARILGDLQQRHTGAEEQRYFREHVRRYAVLLRLVERILGGIEDEPARILDVGAAYQTEAMRALFPNAAITTLGFSDHRFVRSGEHVEIDLNEVQAHDAWPALEPQNLIVLAEVLEHLHVSPVRVLEFLATSLVPGGHLLVQTPNAASLPKRLKLLLGRNPYEPIREDAFNPGHFHEYTVDELLAAGQAAGLSLVEWFTANYFDHGSRKSRAFVAAGPLIPPRLREGVTVWFRKSG